MRDNFNWRLAISSNKLRKNFMPISAVRDGHHFNLNELIKAYEVYENLRLWRQLWNRNQLSLFGCQVIGYLERLVTAVDAQVFSKRIAHVAEGLADVAEF